jgi:hypothetical protein
MWNNRNSHSLLVGMQNSQIAVEDSVTVSWKTKDVFTIWSSNYANL